MVSIPKSFVKGALEKTPLIGPIAGGIGLALDTKEIIEGSTPLGATKKIGSRVIKECTPPELYLTGRCLWLVGSTITTIYTGGNPMAGASAVSALRSIIN